MFWDQFLENLEAKMKNKIKKFVRPKALTPKGFRDYEESDVIARDKILKSVGEIYHHYGFDLLETSAVETVEALGKFLPDVDRPNEGVFSWRDEDDKWLALRYDLTAPLARYYAQYRNQLTLPFRRFSMGPVWRNEKPGLGRFKQFYQCDADSIGVPNVTADAEICMMTSDIIENIGILEGDYIVKINNRKILDGILEIIGLIGSDADEVSANKRGIVLRAIDKLDRLELNGVKQLLGEGRKDDSGAFSSGAELSETQADLIIAFLRASGAESTKTLQNLKELVKQSEIGLAGLNEIEQMCSLCESAGFGKTKISIDPTVVRGLGYYTGPVFEAQLTFDVFDKKGIKREFGSVVGGGRYDNLIKRFTGQSVPATGVSVGVDRLLSALKVSDDSKKVYSGPVLVTVMDKNFIPDYQIMVQELRRNNIRAEMFLGNPKDIGRQLKYADQRNSPIALIMGSEEVERGIIQIKDLELGSLLSKEIKTNQEWKALPAQTEEQREQMVAAVQKILRRKGEGYSEA